METAVDVAVVGGGVIGSCAAYSLAQAGKKTLLLDQFAVPHMLGSSGGKARITRLANFGTEYLTPIMDDAYKQWLKISDLVQEELMSPAPLVIASQQSDFIDYIASTIKQCGHTPKRLTPREINAKHKTSIPEDLYMVEDPTSATLRADRCVLAVQKLYRSLGGVVLDRWPVTRVEPGRPWIKISGPRGYIRARSLVLCPGPWAQRLLTPLGVKLPLRSIRTKTFFWNSGDFPFPAYVHFVNHRDYFYALPSLEHPDRKKVGYNKIPEEAPAGGESERSFQRKAVVSYFNEHFSMDGDALDSGELCWYTMTPDKEFILDRHPQHDNIVYAVGFSGTGFKIAPTLGNILAAMVQGRDPGFPVSFFRAARFTKTDEGPSLKSKF